MHPQRNHSLRRLSVGILPPWRAVVGVDPEPDMLALARRTTSERGVTNAWWLLGDQLIGAVFSAMSAEQAHSPAGATFAADVRDALEGREPLTEQVHVWLQFGHTA